MNKRFSGVSLVTIVLVLIAVQVDGFFPFDYESEFAQNFDENSLLSESQVYEPQSHYFHEVNPEETSLLSQPDLPHDSFETQQFPFEINPNHRIKSPSPSPLQVSSPAPSPVEVPSPAPSPIEAPHPPKPNPENTCKLNCKLRCLYHYADLIYTCTGRCAESMPNNFKSEKKKGAAYVKYCYKKCIKNF
ncbi:hypothetical protein V6Z11_D09G077200 [Gossypium hirsutum]